MTLALTINETFKWLSVDCNCRWRLRVVTAASYVYSPSGNDLWLVNGLLDTVVYIAVIVNCMECVLSAAPWLWMLSAAHRADGRWGLRSELSGCVKVEVAVLGSPSLTVLIGDTDSSTAGQSTGSPASSHGL